MTTPKTSKRPLSAQHHTVAHTSKHRTRLRVPKNKRGHVKFSKAKQALEAIPGVRSVEINDDTGSLLIHHDETPGLFEDVSEAAGIADTSGKGLGVAFADFNGSGWSDIFVANDSVRQSLYRNRRSMWMLYARRGQASSPLLSDA